MIRHLWPKKQGAAARLPRGAPAPAEMDLAAGTVAERLRDGATQTAALEALEDHAAPIPTATAL
eukprot:COSAG06_NODE_6903_length_2723_cov_3.582317_1_plen_63_part_10